MTLEIKTVPRGPRLSDMPHNIELSADSETGHLTLRSSGLGSEQPWSLTRTLVGQLLAACCVESVVLDRSQRQVQIRLLERSGAPSNLTPSNDLKEIARQLRQPIASDNLISDEYASLNRLQLHKSKEGITAGTIAHSVPGRLRIRHPLLRLNADHSQLKRELMIVPGVQSVTTSSVTGSVLVIFDGAMTKVNELVAQVERSLTRRVETISLLKGPPASRWVASAACLGLAVASEFLLPGLAPVTAAALVGFNVPTMIKGIAELCTLKWRVASLYTVIMGTTLISGQFLAAALMQASITGWHGWSSRRLRLIADQLQTQAQFPIVLCQSHRKFLVDGQRFPDCLVGSVITIDAGMVLPYDGIVVVGKGELDERSVLGTGRCSRRKTGDRVFAGSQLTRGRLEVRVTAVENQTRVSKVRETLFASMAKLPGSGSPTKKGHESASRFVPLTFATGTAAILVGDITTLAAVLRPDFATGPSISERYGTLSSISHLWARGWLVTNSEILSELARTDNVVVFYPTGSKSADSIGLDDGNEHFDSDHDSPSPPSTMVRRDVKLETRDLTIHEIYGDANLFLDCVQKLHQRSRRLAVVAPGAVLNQLADGDLIRISSTPDESLLQKSADLIALHSEFGPIEDLWRVLLDVRRPLKQGWAAVMTCNALAISGAFLVGLTSLHVVILTNLGALAAGAFYSRHLRRSSQMLTRAASVELDSDPSQGPAGTTFVDKPSTALRPTEIIGSDFAESWNSRMLPTESSGRRPRQLKNTSDSEITATTSLT